MSRTGLTVLSLLVTFGLAFAAYAPAVSAQTQSISVSRGTINLGMTTNITVKAPAAGVYTAVVVRPDGSKVALNYTFTSAGQSQSANFGNSSLGFKTTVTQVGTYNVFLEQGNQVISATSFYATNQLNVWMDFVNGGLCDYISGADRGFKIFPRFYITYASNGAPLNKSATNVVTFTLPDSSKINASYHAATKEAPFPYGFYIGKFQPNWNYSAVGPWSPTATIIDGLGNTATYQYVGPAFELTPARLSESVQLIDTRTSQAASGFYNGQTVAIQATISYPTNAEAVPGYVGFLNPTTRGGSVNALVGWGFYNSTSGTFGGAKNPGGLIASVPMTYVAGTNGTWAGNLSVSNLPAITAGSSYEVIVTSSDAANPPNQGFATVSVPPATFAPGSALPTTVTQTVTGTQTTVTQTVTGGQTTVTSSSSASSGGVTFNLALAATVGTLIVGLLAGMIVRPARQEKRN